MSSGVTFDYEVTLRQMSQTLEPLMSILNRKEPVGPSKVRRSRMAGFVYFDNALKLIPLAIEPNRNNAYGGYDEASLSFLLFCPCKKPLDILGLLSLIATGLLLARSTNDLLRIIDVG